LFAVLTHPLPLLSLGVALAGIFFAYAVYHKKWIRAESIGKVFGFPYYVFSRRYFMDELYERVFTTKVLLNM
jgi:NADH-quinone oxidoreductase subunit L